MTDPTAPSGDRVWELAANVIGRYPYAILHGPPGTGKTSLAVRTLRERSERVVNLYITPETTAAELMGYMMPTEAGGFEWRDGPLSVAMRHGLPIIINEIDDVVGDAETALLGVLDDQDIAQYELMSGEMLSPTEGFTAVATTNAEPEALRSALADRFPIRIHVATAHPGAVGILPADLQAIAREATQAQDDRTNSIRCWLAFATARDDWGLTPEDAAFVVWQEGSQDILNQIAMKAAIEE